MWTCHAVILHGGLGNQLQENLQLKKMLKLLPLLKITHNMAQEMFDIQISTLLNLRSKGK